MRLQAHGRLRLVLAQENRPRGRRRPLRSRLHHRRPQRRARRPQRRRQDHDLEDVAHQAVIRGHTVRFSTASDMLADLAAQESSAALARRLHRYTVPALLCIDEVGYLSYDGRYADLLFEVVTRRYDAQKPILLSTNKAFSDWGQVFPHAACVVTLVDRLVHRAEVIEIEAESYRLKEAKELSASRIKQRRAKKH
ncbi:ATP-binding protein [Sorangium sp. So ce145]